MAGKQIPAPELAERPRAGGITRSYQTCVLAVVAVSVMAACQTDRQASEDAPATEVASDTVRITAKNFEFEAPGAIPSGWNTLRFHNASDDQEHMVVLYHLPEGKGMADWRPDVATPFFDVWERYDAGELTREQAARALGEEMAGWFHEKTEFAGGVGLTEPGRTSQVSLDLDSGTYVMECYIRTPQGTWHTNRGMMRELTVTGAASEAVRPDPDSEIAISVGDIAAPDTLAAGTHTIAVHVPDDIEGSSAQDVHLFRLASDTVTVDEIVHWLDPMDPRAFRAPAPGLSLGGVEHLMPGDTGYMKVDLEPGRDVWASVAEGVKERDVAHAFSVK